MERTDVKEKEPKAKESKAKEKELKVTAEGVSGDDEGEQKPDMTPEE